MIQFVPDRQGHDFRYSLDTHKIESLGFEAPQTFDDRLKQTVQWYIENEWWWNIPDTQAQFENLFHQGRPSGWLGPPWTRRR